MAPMRGRGLSLPLTILSVAFPFAPVRPEVAGGAEQVLLTLDRALTDAGHRSIVIAAENSAVRGELIGMPVWDDVLEAVRDSAARCHRNAIEAAIAEFAPDVVHYHGFDFPLYAVRTQTPSMATLHLPPNHYHTDALMDGRVKLFCVSDSQRRRCPRGAAIDGVISNGVDVAYYRPSKTSRSYVIALGRICPEKGFHLALDAARLAGIPLILAGEVFAYEAHRRYFESEIRPRLDAHRKFIGSVGPERKRRLLSGARCLIAPSQIDETSSLTAMEALACGTPVIARPAGALPEIVDHGNTGFIAENVEGIAEAIGQAGALSRAACRQAAETRFDVKQMIARYFDTFYLLRHPRRLSACSN
jgi:glycosyltransferase involved in cell wall biosynthesis